MKHEFYADPTVFDYWQSNARDWFCARLGVLCPYAWSLVFLCAALSCVMVAAVMFFNLLLQSLGGQDALAWNHLMAQALTIVIALTVTHAPMTLAVKAWPEAELPGGLARLARWCGLPDTGVADTAPAAPAARASAAADCQPLPREVVQAFFAEVRAAGVNVAIAQALFKAGIRSAQQLSGVSDEALLSIRGVGPATLHRLRARFGSC